MTYTPKKILHVVGAMNRAGTETMLMNIYRNIDHNKSQFDFISYSKNGAHYDQEIESLNGKVIRLTKTHSIKQLYMAMKQNGPYDVVHAHTLFHCGMANVAGFLAGVKTRIAHAHTTSDEDERLTRKVYMICMRFLIIMFSTNLVACSKEAGQYLFGKKRMTKDKYMYFPNVIDYTRFLHVSKRDVNRFKQEQNITDSHIVIGHIGTFKASKNHLFLIRVLEQLVKKKPTIRLLLVGDGELKKNIQKKVEQKGLQTHVTFIGVRDDIPAIVHSMDVFVFPSTFEGLGLVLLEAQASGVPCLVSEAIQPEADLDLNLLVKMPLTEGVEVWADRVLQVAHKRETDKNKITYRFQQHGYSLTNGLEKLNRLYKLEEGGAYEQHLNRIR